MTFTTVFSVTDAPFRNWWFPVPGLLFASIGAAAVFRPDLLPAAVGARFRRSRLLSWYFLLFGGAWTIGVASYVFIDSYIAVRALNSGDYEIVEGRVSHFVPMPWQEHTDEYFQVNGVPFAYSDYEVTAGFNRSSSHGGPIREGLPVRIAYRNGEILRLDVER